ncbi:hypothetical protein NDU88_000404 [Pleurodeles waltl]|uniref:Uncharacterized protein n=1 Tax=Pleurodeles waltl TaxID=8319 RepID=A0AAV7VYB3_PLEWA|nr:hypothetical protein NDU88_000404 [Pleurodeles waltl]
MPRLGPEDIGLHSPVIFAAGSRRHRCCFTCAQRHIKLDLAPCHAGRLDSGRGTQDHTPSDLCGRKLSSSLLHLCLEEHKIGLAPAKARLRPSAAG